MRSLNLKKRIMPVMIIAFVVIISCAAFTGCGKGSRRDANTFILSKDGTVTQVIVEPSPGEVTEKEFREYIDNEIDAFNEKNENDGIKLKKCEIGDSGLYAELEYSSIRAYSSFNSVVAYCGTVKEAVSDGWELKREYTFPNGKRFPFWTLITDYSDCSVLIISEPMNVEVPGMIAAVSAQVTAGDTDKASIPDLTGNDLPAAYRAVNSDISIIIFKADQ